MKFSFKGIKLIEEAIEKGEMIAFGPNGKVVSCNDPKAELFIKTYKTDKVSDVIQRVGTRVRPQTKQQSAPRTTYVNKTYYNNRYYNQSSSDDGCCARGVTLARISNRYM